MDMKFSVGYQMRNDLSFIQDIIAEKTHIDEVYFSWSDFPNGRNMQTQQSEFSRWEAHKKQESDLDLLFEAGIKFNLLFNANCYGADSLSRAFYNKIGDSVDYLMSRYELTSVTTTSPVIAKFIKNNFETLKVRASVNMKIGTTESMDYLANYFDGYYMQREYNRNFDKIAELKAWCENRGKKLYILANSGCLNNCSAHTFHDNLVAHENEISQRDNAFLFEGICSEYLKEHEKRIALVRDTNFIRPEDVALYEPYFLSMKLATRVSPNPSLILRSYIDQKYSGNILELLEPNHSGRIYPYVLDNKKLGNSYLSCDKNCRECNKCREVFEKAFVKLEEV